MARRDALLRLHKSLTERRDDIRRKLAEELSNMRNFRRADSTGDAADAAFETGSDEMASQLAALDARELHQIDRAIARLKQGTYGLCEGCQAKIPVSRLNALPYTTLCIACQREMEQYPDWGSSDHGSWEKVADNSVPLEDQREVNLATLEMDLSK
jgi:DnaK suppressor protein